MAVCPSLCDTPYAWGTGMGHRHGTQAVAGHKLNMKINDDEIVFVA